MAVVVKREYTPIPAGIYNLRVEGYELKEKNDKSSTFYQWKVSVLDQLPADYQGQASFTFNTSTDLTTGNNLNKFLGRIGVPDVAVGEGFDLDTIKGFVFVGKVVQKKGQNGRVNNELGDINVPEYNAWLAQTGQAKPAPAPAPRAPQAVVPKAPARMPLQQKVPAQAPAPAPAPVPASRPAPVRNPVMGGIPPRTATPVPAPQARTQFRPAVPRPATPQPVQQAESESEVAAEEPVAETQADQPDGFPE